jgi:hypothetical protein
MINGSLLMATIGLLFLCFILSFLSPRKRDLFDYSSWQKGRIDDYGLIKSNKCSEDHPSVVTLFHASCDTDTLNNFK